MNKSKVCIIGAGSYGTALAHVLSYSGNNVILYSRNQEQVDTINNFHINPKRFSKKRLSDNVTATNNLKESFQNVDIIINSIPCQHTPIFLEKHKNIIPKNIPFISTSKGIYCETNQLLSEIIPKYLSNKYICYLSGPSFASEMITGTPVSVVLASENFELCSKIQNLISSDILRIYITDDITGVEVGGALKNPIAIGIGIATGLGYGKSTIASLITIGCNEMAIIAKKLGGKPQTLAGLSGMGDLILTCYSSLSRNNRFGYHIGKGLNIEESFDEVGELVEGFPTCKEIDKIMKKYDLQLPFFNTIYSIMFKKREPYMEFLKLLNLKPGIENFGFNL